MKCCFFQANVDSGLGEYATIHITPEMAFSYVSFETNIPSESYMDLVNQVINTFLPGKFIVTFYATRVSKVIKNPNQFSTIFPLDISCLLISPGAEEMPAD